MRLSISHSHTGLLWMVREGEMEGGREGKVELEGGREGKVE